MVRNLKGGNKAKKQRNSFNKFATKSLRIKDKRPDSSELYGKITKRLGGSPPQILVLCEDGIERKCVVRGKFKKRLWMNPNEFVLILYNRELNDNKGEIQHKYNITDVDKLAKKNEIDQDNFGNLNERCQDVIFEQETQDEIEDEIADNNEQRVFIADLDNGLSDSEENSNDNFDMLDFSAI